MHMTRKHPNFAQGLNVLSFRDGHQGKHEEIEEKPRTNLENPGSTFLISIFDIRNMPEGLDFLTSDESFIQVGTWNYKKDKILDAHFHNYYDRTSYRTQEVVYVLQGKIKCNLYEEDTTYIDSAIVESGMMIVQFQGVHEYEMIEDSKVLEVKNGPYHGPEKDRTRVNVKKD